MSHPRVLEIFITGETDHFDLPLDDLVVQLDEVVSVRRDGTRYVAQGVGITEVGVMGLLGDRLKDQGVNPLISIGSTWFERAGKGWRQLAPSAK